MVRQRIGSGLSEGEAMLSGSRKLPGSRLPARPNREIPSNSMQEPTRRREATGSPVDLSNPHDELARITARIKRRHGGRCAVPGCRNRIIEAHHEDGWRRGHGPERCLPLCPAHHKQRHQGWLTLALADGRWTFFRKDGTWLGKAGDDHKATDEARTSPRDFERRVSPPLSHAIKAEERGLDFARAKGSRAEVDAAAQVVPVRPTPSVSPAPGELSAVTSSAAVEVPAEARVDPADLMRDAVSALRGLELRKREAEGLVRLALASEPEREWSLGDLIGQALRSMPTRHLTG